MSKKQRGRRGRRSEITRRDFLNGVAVTLGGALTLRAQREALAFEPGEAPASAEYYPPVKTGMRGSHEGSFEAFHHVRDGQFWATAGAPEPDPETYDLIVVGGGLSGLASACLFRAEAGARQPRADPRQP
jgi:spermidine dehydrogenase